MKTKAARPARRLKARRPFFLPATGYCLLLFKGRAADAFEVVARRVELALVRGGVVGEEDDAVRAEGARGVDLLDGRLGRDAVRADAGPDAPARRRGRRLRDPDLLAESLRVGRVGHRADHVEDAHREPAPPVLEPARVGVLVVGEDR